MKMFLFDNPAVEIWACLAMFKLKSPPLYFWPLYIAWSRERSENSDTFAVISANTPVEKKERDKETFTTTLW